MRFPATPTRFGRWLVIVALLALGGLMLMYWRAIIFSAAVLLYTAWHKLAG
jgi:hypothetical protein